MKKIISLVFTILLFTGCSSKLMQGYREANRVQSNHYNRGSDGKGSCVIKNGLKKRCIDNLSLSQCRSRDNKNVAVFHSVGKSCN